jgi:hypothetical protein
VKGLGALLTAFAAVCGSAGAAELHVDTFTEAADGTMGWAGGSSPIRVATGGPGDNGPYMSIATGTNLATNNLDAPWSGDYAAIGADRINVDMMAPAESEPLPIRVVLFGPNTLGQRWTSKVAQTVPNDGEWRNYTFSLAEADLVATVEFEPPGSYSQIMASVLRVMLRYDPDPPSHRGTFVNGILNVDNVALSSGTPPPGPGDFDGDGIVDADDLNDPTLGWRARYGTDLDGNAFLDWQRNLDAAPTAAALQTVPEPATFSLVLAAAALGIWRIRNQSR